MSTAQTIGVKQIHSANDLFTFLDDARHQFDLNRLNIECGEGYVIGAELVANRLTDGSTTYDIRLQHVEPDPPEPKQPVRMERPIGDTFVALTDEHGVTNLWEEDRLVRRFTGQVTDRELQLFTDGLRVGRQDGEREGAHVARHEIRRALGL